MKKLVAAKFYQQGLFKMPFNYLIKQLNYLQHLAENSEYTLLFKANSLEKIADITTRQGMKTAMNTLNELVQFLLMKKYRNDRCINDEKNTGNLP